SAAAGVVPATAGVTPAEAGIGVATAAGAGVAAADAVAVRTTGVGRPVATWTLRWAIQASNSSALIVRPSRRILKRQLSAASAVVGVTAAVLRATGVGLPVAMRTPGGSFNAPAPVPVGRAATSVSIDVPGLPGAAGRAGDA